MSTRNKNNTGIIIAVAGGGALLFWLLRRGRGKGKGGGKDRSSSPAPVTVWILGGDRLALDRLDGVSVDLAAAVDLARAAGRACVHVTGDARHGWVEKVKNALLTAGVRVDSFL